MKIYKITSIRKDLVKFINYDIQSTYPIKVELASLYGKYGNPSN